MWEQLHQKFELRKASGLASWEAVPSSPFELDLGPGFFTSGFGLKGAEGTDSPHYTQGFSTDCHSNQISTVNKRTEWKIFQPMSALGLGVAKQQENGRFV